MESSLSPGAPLRPLPSRSTLYLVRSSDNARILQVVFMVLFSLVQTGTCYAVVWELLIVDFAFPEKLEKLPVSLK